MAYGKEELEIEALELIEEHELVFFDELTCYMEPVIRTLYDHNLHEMHSIRSALKKNKLSLKKELRKKWKDSDNATTSIALYKLVSDDTEFGKLTGAQVDHTTKGNPISISVIRDDG